MASESSTPLTTTKRTTRSTSSSLQTPTKPSSESSPPPSQPKPPTLQTLLTNLPARRSEILFLLRLLGPPNSPILPLLLYGSPSTGKTTSVLQILRHLDRPFVYISCRSCYCPKILFESVLNQLSVSTKRCERPSDFVNLLRDALVGKTVYLVFDNVERIRSWDKNGGTLSLLFRLYDILKMPQVGLIYISSSTPDAYYSSFGSVEPVTVYFSDYTVEDLHSILIRSKENPKLYSSFLSVVLKPFCRITRRVDELLIGLEPLFRKYCEPLADLRVVPDETTKRRLFDNIQRHLSVSLNEMFRVDSVEGSKEGGGSKKWNGTKIGGMEGSKELEFHMSESAKYLLLSAFLASRNPATLDAALFDSTGGSSSRKRKRKSSQTSMEQKEDKAQELLMKGPGSFPLERLLAIFQCITSVAEWTLEEEQPEDGVATEGGNAGLTSDVLLELSTLCNANFLCKSGSCPLEGSVRYQSCVDEELALKVARSINFPLSKYLYRR